MNTTRRFIGRRREVDEVLGHVRAAAGGRASLTLVEGDAGVGKTGIIHEALGRLQQEASGSDAVRASVVDEGPGGPCRPWRVFATSVDPNDPRNLHCLAEALGCRSSSADAARARLGQLVGHLMAPGPASVVGAVEELLVDLVEREALAGPIVLVIDDIQWADDASLALLASFTRRLADLPLAILAASRPSGRVQKALGDCRPARVTVGDFSDDELSQLITLDAQHPPTVAAREAAGRVRSNALLVTMLAEMGAPAAVASIRRRDLLQRLVVSVDVEAVPVLQLAAAAGRTVDIELLARATERPAASIVAFMQHAVRRGILESDSNELRFRHDLFVEALLATVAPELRDHLHLQLGRAHAELGRSPGRAAFHLDAASYLLTREDVPALLDVLGALAARDDVALALAQRARQLDPQSGHVASSLIACLSARNRHREALDIASTFLGMDHAGPASELARVRLLAARAAVNVVGSESAAAMLHDALGHALPDELRAEALNALARLRWYDRDAAAVEAAATDALAVSRSLGSVPGQVAALCSLSEAASLLSDLESARHHADQALALVRRHGLAAAPAELALGTALVSSGSFAEGLPLLTASLLSAELDGDPAAMALPQIVLQGSRFHTGDWDDFVADADAMVAIGRDTGVRSGIVFPLGLAALVATRREPHAVRSLHARLRAEQTVGDAHPGSVVGALLGELAELEVAGRTGDAARAAVSLVELLGPTGFTAQALVLMEAVRLAWEVGDSESLTTLRDIAAAGAARSPTATRTAIASFCETLLGAAAEDVASAAAGIAATERTWDGAVALHIAGLIAHDARQSHASSALLREATIRYRSLGAGQYAASAESRRGFAGVFVGEPIGAMATHDTAAALSGAERKVLRLVASGMSNGEIAAELFVSKRTVESHVGALYRKLGVSTRVALAAVQSSQA